MSWIEECAKFLPCLKIEDLDKFKQHRNVDVFVTQTSTLRTSSAKRNFLDNCPPKYVIIDECHTWIRGTKSKMSLQLTFWRNRLLPKVDAVFGLSGTLAMTDPRWDLCESIKSIATQERRRMWLDAKSEADRYTDAALQALYDGWADIEVAKKQALLIPILMRRSESTVIDGKPAMENHKDRLKMVSASLESSDIEQNNELSERGQMLKKLDQRNASHRMVLARWLAWTPWFYSRDWQNKGRDSMSWWDDFRLEDARQYARGRKLVDVLKEIKREGGKPIVFASYIFLLEFAAKVCHLFLAFITIGVASGGLSKDCAYLCERHRSMWPKSNSQHFKGTCQLDRGRFRGFSCLQHPRRRLELSDHEPSRLPRSGAQCSAPLASPS